MKISTILVFAIILIFNSCKDSSETRVVKNPRLSYEYRDNLRGDEFQIVIKGKSYILNIIEKNGTKHVQEEPITKVLEIIDKNADENILKQYIINTYDYSHLMITEYYDKVEIQTEGYIDKYEDSNDVKNYRFKGEKIYAIKSY